MNYDIYRCINNENTPKNDDFKAIILSIKIYKNILKFNFLMDGGMGVLDILTADAMKCVIFMGTKKNFE